MTTTPYPLINGHRYDWSAVQITLDGLLYTGVKSINYKQDLKPGKLRGTRAQVTGRTRGQYEASGSIEMYKEDYQDLIDALSAGGLRGYMEVSFKVVVQYQTSVLRVITDSLAGVRLTSDEESPQEGTDPLTVKSDLDIMYVLKNGRSAVSPDQLLR